MSDNYIPGPESAIIPQQHACAAPKLAAALSRAIEPQPEILRKLHNRHVLSIKDFDAAVLRQLFGLAARYESGDIAHQPARGRILSNMYVDLSREHTRLSFNAAWQRLGGSMLNFERSLDEITRKRHAPMEIAEVCSSYSDITVLRTMEQDSFAEMVSYFRKPVINAGNGADEHPTHAMADLYTLFKWRPDLLAAEPPPESRLRIAIAGDPANTRTLRSLLFGLAHFPQAVDRIVLFGHVSSQLADDQRQYLKQAGLKIDVGAELYPEETTVGIAKHLLPQSDLVYIHYLHHMHASRMDILDTVKHLKEDALILNPQIHDEKFPDILNDSPHNGYFAQSRGSVFVRMALYAAILGAV